MGDIQVSKSEKQPISVPFIWEERPGAPKKDWNPAAPRIIKPAPLPVKLVVSVPFGWEEKPGTPLQPSLQVSASSHEQSPTFSSYATCLDNKDGGGKSDTDIDTSSVQTDDSFRSAKSKNLLSGAVPLQKASLSLATTNDSPLQITRSPASEAESVASSYATGTTGLVGASFLEWLFPLLVPNSSLGERVESEQKELPHGSDGQINGFLYEGSISQVQKPLLTLGELMVMSRRRSCQRKIKKRIEDPSMDFMRRNALGCCIFGIGNGISGLAMKWKRQLKLKLLQTNRPS